MSIKTLIDLLRVNIVSLIRIASGFLLILAIILFLVNLLFAQDRSPPGSLENPLKMIFVPSGDSQVILRGGEEIARLLEEETDLKFKSSVATSYAAAIEAMGAGKVDVGWLGTFSYVLAREKYGVDLLLIVSRFGSPVYRGQIVVRADSGIRLLSELKGKTFAYVDPASTSGHIFPKTLLLANGFSPDRHFAKSLFAGSHNAVIFSVLKGQVDAGATYDDARVAVAKTHPEVFDRVKVIAYTEDIPNDTVAVRRGIPHSIKEKIGEGLKSISNSPAGSKVLKRFYGISGLMDFDSFFDPVRKARHMLGLESIN